MKSNPLLYIMILSQVINKICQNNFIFLSFKDCGFYLLSANMLCGLAFYKKLHGILEEFKMFIVLPHFKIII